MKITRRPQEGWIPKRLHVNTNPRKLIIDCDPGVDDSLALILAIESKEIELIGITTVYGNADVDTTTGNALRVVELSGQPIPVARGAEVPSVIPPREHPDFVHGADGLGNTALPEPKLKPAAVRASEFIVQSINESPGEVTLMAVGPLTNLAEALALDPSIVDKVKEVVVMGGVLYRPGNVTPVAEANIYSDPHAADLVFTSPWQVTMVGLDVTLKVFLSRTNLERICKENAHYGPFLHDIHQFYMAFYESREPGSDGCPVHDSSALMYLLRPSLFQTVSGPMRVVTEGIATGQCIRAAYSFQEGLEPWSGKPRVTVPLEVNADGFIEHLMEILLPDE
ncbi:nucleoside hydrolase [Pelagicoccus albus]|uniref:Nucleoside hydrolase n=1 Tax=Pelagicoccus albus TaxID=415222 RepID=A0A7X1B6R5_9BACT|nr:nucleoside hydrolase [Pelagicoccus albus]MBC2606686.1 nucleoside hydrolase [Pelagicoccus albus]